MKRLLTALILICLHGFAQASTNLPPAPPRIEYSGAVTQQVYVYAADLQAFTNDTTLTVFAIYPCTVTKYTSLPFPVLEIPVEQCTGLVSNEWEEVDCFWMPLTGLDPAGFYRINPRVKK